MQAVLERVIAKHRQLVSVSPLPEESLQSLRDDVLVRYAHETTAIEGNTLSLEETKMILQDGISI